MDYVPVSLTNATGYEIHGMEKVPDVGAALIVYYHGAIPIDYYYFLANVIIQKGRTCHSVADHFLFKIPGVYTYTHANTCLYTLYMNKLFLFDSCFNVLFFFLNIRLSLSFCRFSKPEKTNLS